ncbi:TonB-dependent receptor plug domain-containing protein [Prevotella sp. OH937_COT-195]|uniref:TonB-dependent receptor plug domain-containing protein n=1 Tax=Prevotella sp. OH937_COT-195 TaxID=2491051 RepID=UPI000F648C52|nr:TonB-dependent receptor [Prevotella sp. OH937_COT-195]RRC99472.1 TonB-dependent receptor [Prevotella sp. OH937_COT-195]
MRHIITFIVLSLIPAICRAQHKTTVREEMERIKTEHRVNFVYEGSLPLDTEYTGVPLVGNLKQRLRMLFDNSGITFRQKGVYVMLFRKDATRHEKKRVKKQMRARQNQWKEELEADIFRSDSLDEVVIRGDMRSRVLSTQTGKRTLSAADLNSEFSLLSSPDLLKTLQRTSGVQEGVELTAGMHVHGGNNDENLFLIDNTPVYGNSHALGLFSAFNTDVINRTDFYKSGFPARFGGRISSVTDVHTIDGDTLNRHGLLNIGLIDGRIMLEGPIKLRREREQMERGERQGYSTTYVMGMRRTWLDAVTVPAMYMHNKTVDDEKIDMRYFLHDINAKLTHRFSPHSRIYLSLYSSKDYLKFRDDIEDNNQTDNEKWKIYYGNINVAAGWKGTLTKTLSAEFCTTLAYYRSRYEYATFSQDKIDSEQDSKLVIRQYRSSVRDLGMRAVLHWRPSMHHDIHFGGDMTYHVFRPQTRIQHDVYGKGTQVTDSSGMAFANRQYATEAKIFAEDEMHIGERWSLNIGIRAGMFHTHTADGTQKNFLNIDPRVALKFQASHSTSVKLSLSEMTQTIHCINNAYLPMPTDYWVPTTPRLRPMHSLQIAAGIYMQLSKKWFVSLESYWKESRHMLMSGTRWLVQIPANHWDKYVNDGHGRFYGIEADASYHSPRLTVDASYTLSWNRRNFSELYNGWFYDKFDSRHKFNITARLKMGRKAEMYAAWVCRTGHRATYATLQAEGPALPDPETGLSKNGKENEPSGNVDAATIGIYNTFGTPNNIVLPVYHRLDIGFNLHHVTRRGKERILNVSIYNVYNRINSVFLHTGGEQKSPTKLRARGLVPIIPSISYTMKF